MSITRSVFVLACTTTLTLLACQAPTDDAPEMLDVAGTRHPETTHLCDVECKLSECEGHGHGLLSSAAYWS